MRAHPSPLPLLLIACISVVAFVPRPAHAGIAEAVRQLQLGFEELESARWDRAIHHGTSALRLDPLLAGAHLVLGLGLVGQGADTEAERELLNYLDAPDRTPLGEARAFRALASARGVAPEAWTEAQAAFQEGRCAEAFAAASSLTGRIPEDPSTWLLLGDAHRCVDRPREAFLAYRAAQKRGSAEGEQAADSLRSRLVTLHVKLAGLSDATTPRVEIELASGPLVGERLGRGRYRFTDLPPDSEFRLQVSGLGIVNEQHILGPFAGGESARVRSTPAQADTCSLTTAGFVPGQTSISIEAGGRVVSLFPSTQIDINAGPALLEVLGPRGELKMPFVLPANGQLSIDPAELLPSSLTLTGLAAGSHGELWLETRSGLQLEREFDVERADDAALVEGAAPGAPVLVESLPGGTGRVRVEHPALGVIDLEILVRGGEANARHVDWRSMPRSKELTLAHDRWLTERQESLRLARKRTAGWVVGLVLTSAVSAGAFVASAQSYEQANYENWAAAYQHSRGAHERRDQALSARDNYTTAYRVFLGVGGGAAALSLPMMIGTGTSAHRIRRERRALSGWSPELAGVDEE
jgi:hypothetical protein